MPRKRATSRHGQQSAQERLPLSPNPPAALSTSSSEFLQTPLWQKQAVSGPFPCDSDGDLGTIFVASPRFRAPADERRSTAAHRRSNTDPFTMILILASSARVAAPAWRGSAAHASLSQKVQMCPSARVCPDNAPRLRLSKAQRAVGAG